MKDEVFRVDAFLLQRGDDHGEVDRLRRVADAHQIFELVEGEVEGFFEVFETVERHASAADFALHDGIVAVIAVGGGEVIFEDEAGEALIQHVAGALCPILAFAEAGDLGHRPEIGAMAVGAG